MSTLAIYPRLFQSVKRGQYLEKSTPSRCFNMGWIALWRDYPIGHKELFNSYLRPDTSLSLCSEMFYSSCNTGS